MVDREINPSLPDELVEEILARTEVKTMVRCKTLNSDFKVGLSTPRFNRQHLHWMKATNQTEYLFSPEFGFNSLFYDAATVNDDFNGRFVSEEDKLIEFLASTDGLVLCCSLDNHFYLGNPATDKVHLLPNLKLTFPPNREWASVFFGIGYDNRSSDYKVVRVAVFINQEFKTEVKVYSVNEGSWSAAPDFPHDFPIGRPGIFVKGKLHWKVSGPNNRYSISSLCLGDLTYSKLDMPALPVVFGNLELCYLDDDTLGVYSSMVPVGTPYKLWILQDYENTSSWKKIEINLAELNVTNGLHFCTLQPLNFKSPDRNIVVFCVDPVGTFGEYNITTGVFVPKNIAEVRNCYCTIFKLYPLCPVPLPFGTVDHIRLRESL